ncbi:MAG: DUF2306 domain-containing protein [Pseudomonadota bacterium]
MTLAASAWYVPVLVGQFIFVAYIFYAYGGPLLSGDPTGWNEHLSEAWVSGRTTGNSAVAAHLALAVVIHIGGPLQLVPAVRRRFPTFHRWTGRLFVTAVAIAVISGVYMLLVRDIGAWPLKLGFIAQAVLIVWFTLFAVRHARRREFDVHMRWATRLFLAASSVWFFRVMIMIWFVLTGGIGIDTSTGTGWFLDFMSIGQFLPLAVYEVYNWLKAGGTPSARYAMAGFLWTAAGATTVGVGLAALGMWFPVLG